MDADARRRAECASCQKTPSADATIALTRVNVKGIPGVFLCQWCILPKADAVAQAVAERDAEIRFEQERADNLHEAGLLLQDQYREAMAERAQQAEEIRRLEKNARDREQDFLVWLKKDGEKSALIARLKSLPTTNSYEQGQRDTAVLFIPLREETARLQAALEEIGNVPIHYRLDSERMAKVKRLVVAALHAPSPPSALAEPTTGGSA